MSNLAIIPAAHNLCKDTYEFSNVHIFIGQWSKDGGCRNSLSALTMTGTSAIGSSATRLRSFKISWGLHPLGRDPQIVPNPRTVSALQSGTSSLVH